MRTLLNSEDLLLIFNNCKDRLTKPDSPAQDVLGIQKVLLWSEEQYYKYKDIEKMVKEKENALAKDKIRREMNRYLIKDTLTIQEETVIGGCLYKLYETDKENPLPYENFTANYYSSPIAFAYNKILKLKREAE